MVIILVKQMMDQGRNYQINQVFMHGNDDVAKGKEGNATEDQVVSLNLGYTKNLEFLDGDFGSCCIKEPLVYNQNVKLSLKIGCSKLEPDIFRKKSDQGVIVARLDETRCNNAVLMDSVFSDSSLSERANIYSTENCNNLASNETVNYVITEEEESSNSKKICENDMVVEMLPADLSHRDHNSVRQSESVLNKSDKLTNMGTSSFHNQNVEMLNNDNRICEVVMVQPEHRPCVIEGLVTNIIDIHNSDLLNKDPCECQDQCQLLFPNTTSSYSPSVSVNSRTVWQSTLENLQSCHVADNTLENTSNINRKLSKTQGKGQLKVKRAVKNNSNMLQLLTTSDEDSVISETSSCNVVNKANHVEKNTDSYNFVSEKFSLKTECQDKATSATLAKSLNAESDHTQTICNVSKPSSDTVNKEVFLNFLRGNCVRLSNSSLSESPNKSSSMSANTLENTMNVNKKFEKTQRPGQLKARREAQNNSNTLQLLTTSGEDSVINKHSASVVSKADHTVISGDGRNSVSENFSVKTECQGNGTSATGPLAKSLNVESYHTKTVCNVPKPSSDNVDSEAFLNFLQENNVRPSNSSSSETPCKVVTKYVFISRPPLHLQNKRGFGVLYQQAFRHYYEAKKKRKKKKQVTEQIRKELISQQDIDRKTILVAPVQQESFYQQKSREMQNKSREERRLARELKKDANKELNERVHEKKKERKMQKKRRKKKGNEAELSRSRKVGTKNAKKGKLKQKVPKLDIINVASEKAAEEDGILCPLVKQNGISRTQIWRILKRKQRLLVDSVDGLPPDVKRSKKQNINVLEKTEIEIKQEVTEEEEKRSPLEMDPVDVNVSFQQRGPKMRNRKDLTLQEKVQAIGALDKPGSKLVAVAKRFGVSVSAISRINKNREYILLQSVSGDLNSTQRRSRECKDPELDKVLLRWFRAIESLRSADTPVNISNVLLKEKAHELAVTMGKNYFPSDNWIIRWKNRHNIGFKSKVMIMVQDREELKQLDCRVNISEVLEEMGKKEFQIDQVKRESFMRRSSKPEDLFICEHCGVLTSSKKKKINNHLVGCPASSVRKDLTLEEKFQVVRALEQPGVKMVTLAKKYGVSASAISRIHKNRADILARRASGLANSARRRDRGSKEPEVEKVLCDWFKGQHELGIHISGSMIREKARDIARVMGKDFWPSESWVFRWRHRNNVTDVNTFLYGDSDEGEFGGLERNNDNVEDVAFPNSGEDATDEKYVENMEDATDKSEDALDKNRKEKEISDDLFAAKQFRLPRSVMCEKCGFVSHRVKNNRIKSLRHAKGCPDLKPRNELTYENRARMLKALEEPGATLSSVARQFGVSVSSMSRMNQKKDQILSHSEDHAAQKRIRDCKEPEVAYSLYQWYMQKKAEGVHVTGPKLKEKATKFAAEMGREFTASSGWLGRWRHRYNIISSVKTIADRIDPVRKKKYKKIRENKLRNAEHLVQLNAVSSQVHQDSVGSAGSAIAEPLDPIHVSQPSHPVPVFIHQRFQNPWDITQQQDDSCVWTKEFLTPAGPSVLDDAAVSVAYTYGETVSKPVFHNVFDSFSAMGYPVAMPLDSSMVVNRDYLKQDITEDKYASNTAHLPHSSHNQHPHHLSANLNMQHLHPHIAVSHTHSLTHTQPPQMQSNSQVALAMPPPSPAALEDDPEQQRQVMEALKIMSSFAQKKSLGDQVQAALRTIEMSMKSSARKSSSSSRSSYTSI